MFFYCILSMFIVICPHSIILCHYSKQFSFFVEASQVTIQLFFLQWNNPYNQFVGFADRPVAWTLLFLLTKKKKKKRIGGSKEEKTKHGLRTAKRKVNFGTFFSALCVCMRLAITKCIVKLPTAINNADSSLVIVFTAQCSVSDLTALCPKLDYPTPHPGPWICDCLLP